MELEQMRNWTLRARLVGGVGVVVVLAMVALGLDASSGSSGFSGSSWAEANGAVVKTAAMATRSSASRRLDTGGSPCLVDRSGGETPPPASYRASAIGTRRGTDGREGGSGGWADARSEADSLVL